MLKRDISKWQMCSWHFIAYIFFPVVCRVELVPLMKRVIIIRALPSPCCLTHTAPQHPSFPAAPQRTFCALPPFICTWAPLLCRFSTSLPGPLSFQWDILQKPLRTTGPLFYLCTHLHSHSSRDTVCLSAFPLDWVSFKAEVVLFLYLCFPSVPISPGI